ncbi:hypothetical protein ACFLV0_02525 [Chloroflexota bacterium]
MSEIGYEVVWPRGNRGTDIIPLAPRLSTLEGKTVGFLWNYLFRGDEIFSALEKELTKRYSGINFVGYEVFGSTHGDEEAKVLAALPDKLKQNKCDAVISGIGC